MPSSSRGQTSSQPSPTPKGRREAITSLYSRLAARPDAEDLWKVITDYSERRAVGITEGRATALVLGAILEQGLEMAILTHCLGLDEAGRDRFFAGNEDGPMTFAVKMRFGFALGLYGKNSLDDIDLVRRIRNLFAHDSGHLSFNDKVVADLCNQIKWLNRTVWPRYMRMRKPTNPRGKYIATIRYFFAYFDAAKVWGRHHGPIRYFEQDLGKDVFD